MGREARVLRDRRCNICKRPLLSTAKQLQNHVWLCQRMGQMGLVMPTLERPTVEIIRP